MSGTVTDKTEGTYYIIDTYNNRVCIYHNKLDTFLNDILDVRYNNQLVTYSKILDTNNNKLVTYNNKLDTNNNILDVYNNVLDIYNKRIGTYNNT